MAYRVELTSEAAQALRHLDKAIAQRILRRLRWLSENFPSLTPEPLRGPWQGLYKFRVGSYRVLNSIEQDQRLLTIHLIGHRKDIYKRK